MKEANIYQLAYQMSVINRIGDPKDSITYIDDRVREDSLEEIGEDNIDDESANVH